MRNAGTGIGRPPRCVQTAGNAQAFYSHTKKPFTHTPGERFFLSICLFLPPEGAGQEGYPFPGYGEQTAVHLTDAVGIVR